MKTEQYYMDKLLKMGDEFTKAVIRKDWFQAKYLYDKASTVAVFLEAPQEVREKLFGRYNEERDEKEQGAFDDRSIAKVMRECLIKNNLGLSAWSTGSRARQATSEPDLRKMVITCRRSKTRHISRNKKPAFGDAGQLTELLI